MRALYDEIDAEAVPRGTASAKELPSQRVYAPVGVLRPTGVRHLAEPAAVDVHGVDVAVRVEVRALGEGDLRPVRRPGGLEAALGRRIGVGAATGRRGLDAKVPQPAAVAADDGHRAVHIGCHM